MKVLHVFDVYLPSTLSWVDQLLQHTPASVGIGASWTIQGPFLRSGYSYYPNPMQQWLFRRFPNEFEHPQWYYRISGAQQYLGFYPRWLSARLKQAPPDVIHAHFGPVGCLHLGLARRLKRPLVVSFYGFDYTKVPVRKPKYRALYRRLFAEASAVISCSRDEGVKRLIELGCPLHKIHCISPGIAPEAFRFQERIKPANTLRLVQPATVTPKKGHRTTIEALALAVPTCPGIHVTFAGEEPDAGYKAGLLALARAKQVDGHISWYGFVPHRDMPAFLSGFDAVVHPSCHAPDGDHETTPVILLEAQAVGLPVLATRHWDIPYEVVHGETGLLCAENDALGLAAHMQTLYRMDVGAFAAMSRNARAHVERAFHVADSARQVMGVYAGVVGVGVVDL